MPFRDTVASDFQAILRDDVTGMAWPMDITDPAGTKIEGIKGYSADISQAIDFRTGEAVIGRIATACVAEADLDGLAGIPVGESATSVKPWIVEFDDVHGVACKFRIKSSFPDRVLGSRLLRLEVIR